MEKAKNVALIVLSVIIVVFGLHWWGAREIVPQKTGAVSEWVQDNKYENADAGEMSDVEPAEKWEYHTISAAPDVKVFQTSYKGGTQILFHHKRHSEDYALACIQCHHVENCSKCHLKNKNRTMEIQEGKIALHENCWRCHTEIKAGPRECDECHRQ
jgi:primosomal protein N'